MKTTKNLIFGTIFVLTLSCLDLQAQNMNTPVRTATPPYQPNLPGQTQTAPPVQPNLPGQTPIAPPVQPNLPAQTPATTPVQPNAPAQRK